MNFSIDTSLLQLAVILGLTALGIAGALRGDMSIAHDIALGLVGALALHKTLSASPQS